MREPFGTALVPRLPAPCHVATQGLPASARLCGSAHCQPGCSLTLARHCPPPLPGSSHGSLRAWLPFGPARERPPSRPRVVLRCAVSARPLAECGAPRAVAASRLASLARTASGYGYAFASLSPRAKPSHSNLPSLRAWRRRESAAIVPLPPPCPAHVARRAPPAWNGSRCSRSV